MFFPTNRLEVKLLESKKMSDLEKQINDFLFRLSEHDVEVYQIQFSADKEEYAKHFSAMIVYTPYEEK